MSKVMTQIRIEEDVKTKAVKILEELGLDMTTAINLFLRQVIITKGLPFSVKTEEGLALDINKRDDEEFKKRLIAYISLLSEDGRE